MKTTHVPMHAMYAKLRSNDGMITVMWELLEQSGIVRVEVYKEHVIIMNANLGAIECIESCIDTCHIEFLELEQLQYVEAMPGAFHI